LLKSNKFISRLNYVNEDDCLTFSGNTFQQSKYLKKNEDWRFLLKFEECIGRGLDYGPKVVDNEGGNMSQVRYG